MTRAIYLALGAGATLALAMACTVTETDGSGGGGSTSTGGTGGTTSSGTGGTTSSGTAGGGGADCASCLAYATDPNIDYADMCTASAALWDALGLCVCGTANDPGACIDECAEECGGGTGGGGTGGGAGACTSCTQTSCTDEFNACTGDT